MNSFVEKASMTKKSRDFCRGLMRHSRLIIFQIDSPYVYNFISGNVS